jgi:integrase
VGTKRRDIGLGPFPEITLEKAREKAREAREGIRSGIDPVEQKRADKAAQIAAQGKILTFAEAAQRFLKTKSHEWKNAKHASQWHSTLEAYAFPVIGRLPVDQIEIAHVVRVLEPIWTTKTETATRLRERIERVLSWATVSGFRQGDNPARWKGNLDTILPKPSKVKKVKHHPALPWESAPAFMAELRKREGMAAKALEFTILTAARSSEVRLATWDEIDLEAKLWTVPGERMKRDRTHKVPLSPDAIKLLKALPRFEGCPLVFPSSTGKALSENTLNAVLKRMGADAVPHGFRSSFKDWARNRTRYPDEVSELALAHVNNDATRAAYARDELLPQRTKMMTEWAKFLNTPISKGDVIPMRAKA